MPECLTIAYICELYIDRLVKRIGHHSTLTVDAHFIASSVAGGVAPTVIVSVSTLMENSEAASCSSSSILNEHPVNI